MSGVIAKIKQQPAMYGSILMILSISAIATFFSILSLQRINYAVPASVSSGTIFFVTASILFWSLFYNKRNLQ